MNRRQLFGIISAVGTTAVAGCTSSQSDGPEETAERFIEALAAGDVETQEELIHPEASELYDVNETEFEVTIQTIERRTIDEIDDIDIRESEIEHELDELGADDFAWVYIEYENHDDNTEVDGYLPQIKDDGDWLMYDFL